MARGRKPQPADLVEAKGNPGKRATHSAHVDQAPELKAGAPAWLSEPARKVWARLHPQLSALKLLRTTDQEIFSRYCETVAEYWKTTRALRKAGTTYLAPMTGGVGKMRRIDPRFTVQERLHKRLVELEDRIGLSPRARNEALYRMSNQQPPATGGLFGDGEGTPAGEGASEAPPARGPIGYLQ